MYRASRDVADDQGEPPPQPATATATGQALPGAHVDDPAIGRYDHVTRLPNRVPFLEHLEATMRGPQAAHSTLLLITLTDAHHYNEVLRALGHAFAEDLVRAGGARVAECVGGDVGMYHVSILSFAFVLDDSATDTPSDIAELLGTRFAEPLLVEDIPVMSSVGIGLVELSNGFADPSEALRAALTAAQDSRGLTAAYAYYDPSTDAAHQRAFRLLTEFPKALAAPDQLTLYFQPRVDLATNQCVGAEALLRWRHPELGWITPGEFIPLAETTAFIRPLTAFVMESAIGHLREWQEEWSPLKLSVNVSPRNLGEPDFFDRLTGWLKRYRVNPTRLELEFTEGAVSPDNAMTIAHLHDVLELGMEVAIDDFGSGYSNMAYLTRIPADTIKIDKAFIMDVDRSAQTRFLVNQIVDLANGLGFKVVAEGIETAKTYDFLRDIGCGQGQGFFLGRPMPAAQFRHWVDTWQGPPPRVF
jgi:EAL domain-containing protein (putative c-di-GMP-specific phosphodiesterase class I)